MHHFLQLGAEFGINIPGYKGKKETQLPFFMQVPKTDQYYFHFAIEETQGFI